MDAQTEFAAEIFKTLTQEQKDAILDLVSKMASHEKGSMSQPPSKRASTPSLTAMKRTFFWGKYISM